MYFRVGQTDWNKKVNFNMMATSPVDIYSNIGTYTLVWPDDGSSDDVQYNTINEYKVEVFGAGKLRKLEIYQNRIVALSQDKE